MREILFKAKCIDGGNWVHGDLIHHPYGTTIGVVEDDGLHELYVDENTICQYTGLTDKNGRKIWENDVIDTPYRRFVVAYSDGVWGDRDGIAMRESIFGEGGTVAGNVFDNPELSEGGAR